MLRCYLQRPADMVPAQIPEKAVVFIRHQVIESDAGTDEHLFYTRDFSDFFQQFTVFGVIYFHLLTRFRIQAVLVLAHTVLRGIPSAFTLEMPPYRRPVVLSVLVRSVLDRTLFVLARAAVIAAPAGLLIWLVGNIDIAGISLLSHCAGFLDPLGRLMGLDGMILLAFLLGFPANEIVIPVLLMGYLASGSLTDYSGLTELQSLLVANGWTGTTALCAMIFSLFHFPCGTTCLTIWRETKSLRWTVLAILLPTLVGGILCMTIQQLSVLFW